MLSSKTQILLDKKNTGKSKVNLKINVLKLFKDIK